MQKINFIIFFLLLSFQYLYAQNIGIKLGVGAPNTTLDVGGSVAFREGVALSMTNGVNDNVVIDSMSFYRIINPTGPFSITGFTNGKNGRILTLINASAHTCTFLHQSGSGIANQINTGTNSSIDLLSGGTIKLVYNTTLQKWVVTSAQGARTTFIGVMNEGTSADSIVTISGSEFRKITLTPTVSSVSLLRKTSDESVTNSTVLQDDNDFVKTINANEVWVIDGVLLINGQPGGYSIAFNSGAATFNIDLVSHKGTGLSNALRNNFAVSGASIEYDLDTDNTNSTHIKGIVIGPPSGTATFKVQWAQRSSNGTATTFKQNSYLRFSRTQ